MPTHNLPIQSTPFVGRKRELAEVMRLLVDPGCRMLTLTGPGGIGKTRLAVQAALQLVDSTPPDATPPDGTPAGGTFPDGVFWVPLTAVTGGAGLVRAVAEAVGLEVDPGQPRRQVLDYLRPKRLLLVLDSVEHLLDDLMWTSELLASAPKVKLLVTSREGVNLQEAWSLGVAGLTVPPGLGTATVATASPALAAKAAADAEYDAVQFFELCARRARVDLSLAGDRAAVVQICRMVEGMPLALELAAPWLRVLSVRQVAEALVRDLEILTASRVNLPPRHRNMQVVMEQSWALLAPDEQQVARRLSVFRGGFRWEAAAQVAAASIAHLAALVDKSLLRLDAGGRYHIHELLRQYAATKLAADPDEGQATRARHSAYYLEFIAARDDAIFRRDRQAVLAEVAEEAENVRQAWQWATDQGDLGAIARSAVHVWRSAWLGGHGLEGLALFDATLARLGDLAGSADPALYRRACQQVRQQRGRLYYSVGDYAAARAEMREALALAQELDDQTAIGDALRSLGGIDGRQGRSEAAIDQLSRSVVHFEVAGHLEGVADARHELAYVYGMVGDFAQAASMAEQSLQIGRKLGLLVWSAFA